MRNREYKYDKLFMQQNKGNTRPPWEFFFYSRCCKADDDDACRSKSTECITRAQNKYSHA